MSFGKKNFYFKSNESNNEAFEIYIGQNSGNQLNKDILNAKSEVIVVSPYVDESKINDLLSLNNRKINVKLAFSSLRKEQNGRVLRQLIEQTQHTEVDKLENKKKLLKKFSLIIIAIIIIMICLFITLIFQFTYKNNLSIPTVSIIVSYFLFRHFVNKKNEAKKLTIYHYNYSKKINFKYLNSNFGNDSFIHTKIYIIDRTVAYIGSLNFTTNGFTTNLETRIRITKSDAIQELVEYVNEIFEGNNFKSHDTNWLGKQVYKERRY